MSQAPTESHSRVVIVGAGFGGLTAAKRLANTPLDVTVVDQHNYHLFQPLLYQVATASLSPADIASPIRGILRNVDNVKVILAKVSGIDVARQEVVADGRRIPFDYLIIATGAEHAYFGSDWAQFLHGLKTIDDAIYIRRRILLAFELAETESDPDERRRLLNFVVVGGGPTGVEMAGSIAELANRTLASDFRVIDPRSAHIVLVEAAPRLLTTFDPSLSETARRSLGRLGVEVRLRTAVTECDGSGVSIGLERIESRTIIWAAGVRATPAAQWLGADHDPAGRVKVEPDLSVPGHPNIFVIGDAALMFGANGRPMPGDAGVAKQQGKYVATLLVARDKSKTFPPFRYRHLGSIAAVGRKSAIVQIHWLKLSGLLGWLVWSVAHIYYMVGFRNRSIVAMNWVWNYLTPRRGMRLITGVTGSHIEDMRRCVLSPTAANTGGAALPYAATATLEQSSRQAPQPVHVDGRMDQAGDPANRYSQ
ncbi:NAD(P)/FAD-dependent oxidoreductase [Bradyrhizobium lablabi]|uniref:NAD(P)/FAD-dependent oxidoreductase n=1 Tax=Bradyrhizobium lablabi TaxID=722472 RepID=UPI001BA5AF53|nr:NAD(P)/FAD-dependent oxidoreductase [Bradyrhizobium lablabi]MBR0695263.1 NAD(P)/FAD-dependent oxidoreductase [Bradyrhizobium lablabi]